MTDLITRLKEFRHDLHRHPEIGFDVIRTKSLVANWLRGLGMEVLEGVGVTGVLRSGTGERVIALRADMDALPITETSSHKHVSRLRGFMHACGHDGHTSMLLGAAEKLACNPDFDGTVVFLFQPNEEHGLGALAMIEEGIFERFQIKEVYGIHNLPGAPLGRVSTRSGIICNSETLFEIEVHGQSGHASMPHKGVDAITIGAEIVMALQTIVARKLVPGSGAVVSVTEFFTDGQRNVLPGHATLKGDIRTRSPQDRKIVEQKMKELVHGISAGHGITGSVHFDTQFVETINAKEPVEAVYRAAEAAGLELLRNGEPMSFSEDFAHFAALVPGCFLMLGNGETGPYSRPLHASDYDFNDELLIPGSQFWVSLVQDRLPQIQG